MSNKPLDLEKPSAVPQPLTARFGKPVGLWYGHGTSWIDRTLKPYERPLTYTHKYVFPLEGKFEEDITKPDKTKIFRLTASNIEAFEKTFEPYFEKKLRKTPVSIYQRMLEKPYPDLRTQEEKDNPKLRYGVTGSVETLARLLMDRIQAVKDGKPTDPTLTQAIRLVEYGEFLRETMKPMWGGIDYDESLFTDTLQAKYPFIEQVEVASGCLWHPKEVMKGYTPVDVLAPKGGKRTRRNRRFTRRRRSRKQ